MLFWTGTGLVIILISLVTYWIWNLVQALRALRRKKACSTSATGLKPPAQ